LYSNQIIDMYNKLTNGRSFNWSYTLRAKNNWIFF
jgi:hypothetical protein